MPNYNCFRFSPDILRRLGEELIPHVDQGIIELVRNAFDADAVNCEVELTDTENVGGTIRISDDGIGMTSEDIVTGWLLLGRSAKRSANATRLGRIPAGNKGLGRLACLRLGSTATLRTRPASQPGVEYSLTINWARYDQATTVEDVPLSINEHNTSKPPGTDVEVSCLSVSIGRQDVQRLARSLLLLSDPFDNPTGFRPKLIAPMFSDLEQRVQNAYFHDAGYSLIAQLDRNGNASAEVFNDAGQCVYTAKHDQLNPNGVYKTIPAKFELWVFLLGGKGFKPSVSINEIRSWLDVVGGVHLYQNGLRVHPYGDPGHDWLEMNLARVRSPEERPSTNTSIGRVTIVDSEDVLVQKTDRTGFIENEAFFELRRFAKDALDWMAKERLKVAEKRREAKREEANKEVEIARESLNRVIENVPAQSRDTLKKAVRTFESAQEQEVSVLREEVLLYRTLATVGTTTAVFAHETGQPVTRIARTADTMAEILKGELGLFDRQSLQDLVKIVQVSAQSLVSFAKMPVKLLLRSKRRPNPVDAHVVIKELIELFQPVLNEAKIDVSLEFVNATPVLPGNVAAIESILTNLLTNAVNAVVYSKQSVTDRKVVIRTEIATTRFLLHVLDSGEGITGLGIDEIWLPGRTTKSGGIGLGLTIVRDTVTDLGGRANAVAHSDFGGAEFIIDLPLLKVES